MEESGNTTQNLIRKLVIPQDCTPYEAQSVNSKFRQVTAPDPFVFFGAVNPCNALKKRPPQDVLTCARPVEKSDQSANQSHSHHEGA